MKTVLIIEDDPQLQQMYKRKFVFEQLHALIATTGEEGLQLIKQEKPAVILLDVMLPGQLNGFDVLEVLKRDASTKDIPVIMATNLNSEETVARTIGAVDYIVKADTPLDVIVEKIKTYLPS